MSSLENELQDLRDKNNELAKKVQYWKMEAAQRENEKLELMKESNELRLKLGRLQSGGAAQARKLDGAIQSASKQALSHLVQASSVVAKTMQLVKNYMNERQELETSLPRWSSVNNTPNTDRIHRVPPMMIGGQSIQPVVSLSRTMVDLNSLRTSRTPNNTQNNNFQRRAVPMHDLQDLYIPLTRIDAPLNNMDTDDEEEENNNAEDIGLDDSTGQELQESQNVSENDEFDDTQGLNAVAEEIEPEDEEEQTPRPRSENPLEGPSWMLDGHNKARRSKSKVNLEPDSTTECDNSEQSPLPGPSSRNDESERPPLSTSIACEFTPTVRRRKRTSPPAASPSPSPATHNTYSPRPLSRRSSNNGRILKVIVSKLRLDDDDVTPPKRPSPNNRQISPPGELADNSPTLSLSSSNSPSKKQSRDNSSQRDNSTSSQPRDMPPSVLSFDAPSPNGATTSHVVVSESTAPVDVGGSGEPVVVSRKISKRGNRASRDNSQDNSSIRESSHDNRSSRDNRHENRTKRKTGHDTTRYEGLSSGERHESRGSHHSQDSDSGSGGEMASEGRTRRPRKAVTYKEKPLNRKMRR